MFSLKTRNLTWLNVTWCLTVIQAQRYIYIYCCDHVKIWSVSQGPACLWQVGYLIIPFLFNKHSSLSFQSVKFHCQAHQGLQSLVWYGATKASCIVLLWLYVVRLAKILCYIVWQKTAWEDLGREEIIL